MIDLGPGAYLKWRETRPAEEEPREMFLLGSGPEGGGFRAGALG